MSTRIKPEEHFARLLEVHSAAAAAEDEAFGGMANLANALRTAGRAPGLPSPDPVFRAALRQRLVAVATVQVSESTATRKDAVAGVKYRMQRRIAALAGVVTIATSVAGVGVAAARSLPGNPFYSVKQATEDIQLWATHGQEAKGKRHLEFARTRLAEAEKLGPNSSHFASTLAAMDSQTKDGSSELISAYQSTHSTAPLADLVTFSSQQLSDLNQLAANLPASVRSQEQSSVALLTGVVKQVHKIAGNTCILCGTNLPGSGPGTTRSPNPQRSGGPNPQKSSGPGGGKNHPGSSTHPKKSGGPTTSKSPGPTKSSPTSIIPTNIPTSILPTGILKSILNPPHKHHKPLPIVSTLLGVLGGGKHK